MVQMKRTQRATAARSGRSSATEPMRDSDYAALAQFRYEIRSFLAFSEAAAAKQGLTPTQHQALLGIKGFVRPGPATVGDVARFLLIRPHSAVELINRLAKLGLVGRVADPQDARRVHLKLTGRGEQKLRALSQRNLQELRRAASPALNRLLRSFRHSGGPNSNG
ncbi:MULTISPECIES: MarR family transcriptional regulator [unclassified Bradyrhizobium]|uniref:MarR family winged helix-turn-helix transcriptional regulator n=1 Tax=unclassified Bradyrhizobium TaxID=2631580 RepID=UPI001FF85260|nr:MULTISPECIES: MarR family transcriptional regulator [unclassified Bradyrhizobium]MCK1317294.1 MarR family transcriptional regulator [Bradyrhizobium sp. 23]MCK1362863.1 MarR family transcriptional regulator [Bradyrhizobium sp. 62]MCK1406148.1 MarR family transcriptional regulator [Bradyrhizobium sp. 76]